jgi:hypothetical protein
MAAWPSSTSTRRARPSSASPGWQWQWQSVGGEGDGRGGRRPGRRRAYVHLSVGVAPVVPAARDDDVVHVGVGEDDAGEGAPGAAQVERAGARHPAVDEREPRVLQHALPVLRRQRPVVPRDRVHVAVLQPNNTHARYSR